MRLHPVALGVGYADVSLCTATAGCSGGTFVKAVPGGIEQRPLDSYGWSDIDLIKIDCEGYEGVRYAK